MTMSRQLKGVEGTQGRIKVWCGEIHKICIADTAC